MLLPKKYMNTFTVTSLPLEGKVAAEPSDEVEKDKNL